MSKFNQFTYFVLKHGYLLYSYRDSIKDFQGGGGGVFRRRKKGIPLIWSLKSVLFHIVEEDMEFSVLRKLSLPPGVKGEAVGCTSLKTKYVRWNGWRQELREENPNYNHRNSDKNIVRTMKFA